LEVSIEAGLVEVLNEGRLCLADAFVDPVVGDGRLPERGKEDGPWFPVIAASRTGKLRVCKARKAIDGMTRRRWGPSISGPVDTEPAKPDAVTPSVCHKASAPHGNTPHTEPAKGLTCSAPSARFISRDVVETTTKWR
jgi:hypothetical protein